MFENRSPSSSSSRTRLVERLGQALEGRHAARPLIVQARDARSLAATIRRLLAQLGRHQLQAHLAAGAPDQVRTGRSISSAVIICCRSAALATDSAVQLEDQVADSEPAAIGGAVRHDLDHLDAGAIAPASASPGRERARAAGDAEEAAPNPALAHQGADDLAGGRVDRHRQAEPDSGDRRVDAHHVTPSVGERASRVSRVEGGVGLDHVLDDSRRATARRSGQRPPKRRHDAGRDRALEAVRVADRHHQLAHPQLIRVAELGRGEPAVLGPHDRQVGERVAAQDGEAKLASVGERRAAAARRAATTCAEVRMKPSCVSATPLPAPTGIPPRRVRRWTRRLATAGASLSATPTTARE